MRKKIFAICAAGVLALSLASCDNGGGDSDTEGKRIHLTYSGAASDQTFNETLFENFKAARAAAGDPNTYVIEYSGHGADKIDSEIVDWSGADAPDVYEAAPDKVAILYGKGALARITGAFKTYIDTEMNEFAKGNATFNGDYYAYPYTGDNTYYLQYDKSVYSAEDVKSIEGVLARAAATGTKLAYNLEEGFWGAGALFTFGADYTISFDDDGNTTNITATWDTAAGLKAAKAIYSIVKHPNWTKTTEVPNATNNLSACIAGTWDIAAYKAALGTNYGCAPMPTVTVDGDTQNLGAFLGGKLLGVNPLRSGSTDVDRLNAAHLLAQYLSGEEAQVARFNQSGTGPCNLKALDNDAVKSNENMVVLSQQATWGHEQTSTPANIWTATNQLVLNIESLGENPTDAEYNVFLKAFNDSIKEVK